MVRSRVTEEIFRVLSNAERETDKAIDFLALTECDNVTEQFQEAANNNNWSYSLFTTAENRQRKQASPSLE